MNDNQTPGGGGPSEIKYIAISRAQDAKLLLALPSQTTKRSYADEVSNFTFISPNLFMRLSFNHIANIQFKKEAQTLAEGLKESTAYPDLREQTDSLYGVWFTYVDKNLVSYSGEETFLEI